MRIVDDVILARLRTGVTFDVFDGLMEADNSTNTVTYDVPYAVYYSNVGDDDNARLSGRLGRRSVFWSITYVGLDRQQTKWAGEKLRGLLQRQRITVAGHRTWLCSLEASQRIRRDDDAIRPDGSPLFYGVDEYAMSITQLHTP